MLTVVDIRAVGPGTWNSWKSQLLRELFDAAEELLRLGHKQKGRKERIAAIQDDLFARAGLEREPLRALRLPPARQPIGSPSRPRCSRAMPG